MNKLDYSGDIDPLAVWKILETTEDSFLIDCRTSAEWDFVGIPNLESIQKKPHLVEWQKYPTMEMNVNFINEIKDIITDKKSTLVFMCRSGGRSKSAAVLMTSQGYENCYNCLYGFEGNHDEKGQRGILNGWKFSSLPWKQG